MPDTQQVIEHIRQAFCETEHPGDAFLQGSHDGCEPAEVTAPFQGVAHWSEINQSILDANDSALSFFSEGGFRHFLPAFLIADVSGKLQTADPLFHLTYGFSDRVVRLPAGSRSYEKTVGKSALINPRRYGAMTSEDYARCRLSVFTKEEVEAIVAYLQWKRTEGKGMHRVEIDAALDGFWRQRAKTAPKQALLRQHLQAEADYVNDERKT